MSRPSRNYSAELRERAVRLVAEIRTEHPTEWAAICSVAGKLGIGSAETLRKWVRQAEVDTGARPGTSTAESAEMRRLRAEVRELKRANEICGRPRSSSRPSSTGHAGPRELHQRP